MRDRFSFFLFRFLLRLGLLLALLGGAALPVGAWDETYIFVLNVGYGTATHIQTPNGNYLFDTGPASATQGLIQHLAERRVTKIDAIFLSDLHPDHAGATMALLEQFSVDRVFWSGRPPSDPELGNESKRIGARAQMEELAPGSEIRLTRDMRIYAFPNNLTNRDDNDDALVLYVTNGRGALLFPGDAGAARQRDMAASEPKRLAKVQWMVWPHHGDAMDPLFVPTLKSLTHAAVAVGPNAYGLPNSKLAEWGKDWGVEIARTDTQDTLTYTVEGDRVHRVYDAH